MSGAQYGRPQYVGFVNYKFVGIYRDNCGFNLNADVWYEARSGGVILTVDGPMKFTPDVSDAYWLESLQEEIGFGTRYSGARTTVRRLANQAMRYPENQCASHLFWWLVDRLDLMSQDMEKVYMAAKVLYFPSYRSVGVEEIIELSGLPKEKVVSSLKKLNEIGLIRDFTGPKIVVWEVVGSPVTAIEMATGITSR